MEFSAVVCHFTPLFLNDSINFQPFKAQQYPHALTISNSAICFYGFCMIVSVAKEAYFFQQH
jgi:hypothetical protein